MSASWTSPHNVVHLLRRWEKLARRARWTTTSLAVASGYPVLALRPHQVLPARPSLLLSAGIHGDEPAATEALIRWSESRTNRLRGLNVLIFPCLNPWGLANNSRTDEAGRDLNRCFQRADVPVVAAYRAAIEGERFDLALLLHEDFDAAGVYLYEPLAPPPLLGEHLIAAASAHLPSDPRRTIEGRRASNGIIRRRLQPTLMPDWPEAFWLRFHHCQHVITTETPSERDLAQRISAHEAMLDASVDWLLSTGLQTASR